VSIVRRRVLIVDDQPQNIRVMGEVLRHEYEVFFAANGAKAIEIAQSTNVDLILLDVVLPDLDGFEVCSRLKADERTSGIPIIFVTAREETSDEARGFSAGGVDYITKPIRPPVLLARVRTHLELKHARDLLESLASIDGLTAIANRRRFDAFLEHEWKRCGRMGEPFSLAIVDVDHFKNFNDTYGHARGDDCLRAIAQTLASVARRPADLAARYGGEEFGLIVPGTDAAGMRIVMNTLMARVRALSIPHASSSSSESVSVSIGAITLVPPVHESAVFAVTLADELLYEAKQHGRNQVRLLDVATGVRECLMDAVERV
jgi:diguanylate cyclase (GGDEF)-like protein